MKIKVIFVVLTILVVVIAGGVIATLMNLTNPEPQDVSLNTAFNLKIGESADIESEGIRVTFLAVTQDSRCPKDVTCVWEGDVTVVVKVVLNGLTQGNFELDGSNMHKASFGGIYYVRLIELSPYPETTDPIPLSAYIGNFSIGEYGPD
ncbi:MAG: hypothetical protein ACFFC7_13180 [Candidatus Hermodarchaeota archaeon]